MARRKNTMPLEIHPEKFEGWSKLESFEQDRVRAESKHLDDARRSEAKSKLAQGEYLAKLRDILEPKKLFLAYVAQVFDMSRATAYRYIDLYVIAQTSMPKPILEMAIERGTRIRPQMLIDKPAPRTDDKSKIVAYLDSLSERPRVEVAKSPDTLLKECVNFVGLRWNQLPNNQRARTAFMRSLIGMLMAKFGVASEQTFSPMAIPESFRGRMGRPPQPQMVA